MSKIHNPDNQPFMINARTRLVDTFVERASQHAPLNILSPTSNTNIPLIYGWLISQPQ